MDDKDIIYVRRDIDPGDKKIAIWGIVIAFILSALAGIVVVV